MWAYPTRKEVGWFFDEKINQTVFKRGKLSSKVQARFEEIGKWLKVHCEPQIMELEKRMDAMLREREVKSLRAKPRKVKNLRAKPKRDEVRVNNFLLNVHRSLRLCSQVLDLPRLCSQALDLPLA